MKFAMVVTMLSLTWLLAAQQPSNKAVPDNDKPVAANEEPMHPVAFRNEHLEVLRVVIPAGKSSLYHIHSHDRMAVVLSNAKIRFQPYGREESADQEERIGEITASAFSGNPLTHRVINVGDTPFEVLDVEFLRRPEQTTQVQPVSTVAAENPSARLYKYELDPGASSSMHTHERPYLIVAVTATELTMASPDGKTMFHTVKAGDFHWIDSKVTHTLRNSGKEKAQIVEIELK